MDVVVVVVDVDETMTDGSAGAVVVVINLTDRVGFKPTLFWH